MSIIIVANLTLNIVTMVRVRSNTHYIEQIIPAISEAHTKANTNDTCRRIVVDVMIKEFLEVNDRLNSLELK